MLGKRIISFPNMYCKLNYSGDDNRNRAMLNRMIINWRRNRGGGGWCFQSSVILIMLMLLNKVSE